MTRGQQQDQLATQTGFESFLGLIEGSTPVATCEKLQWYICPAGRGWGAWNNNDFKLTLGFQTAAAAQDYIRSRASERESVLDLNNATRLPTAIDPLVAGAELKPHRQS